jgi:chemotaxis signal transduction protein
MSVAGPARVAGEAGRYLTLRLDREICGAPILAVPEIVELQEISPVLDPKLRFGLGPVEPSDLTVIAALQTADGKPFGALVDEVLEVLPLEPEAPPMNGAHQEFLAGFGKTRDGLVFLLDPAALQLA